MLGTKSSKTGFVVQIRENIQEELFEKLFDKTVNFFFFKVLPPFVLAT